MVGDGINDAAALKAADLGIALSTGTDLSIESADIIITGSSLLSVPDAIRISKITFKKIRQNLFWAFIYNIIALPAAFLGIMHPAIAELCMILSSINVILNSISIKNIKLGE
jgi:Cu+-exporting ATPase